MREGKVDVGKRGMAALWSSVDRATRRALDETALYAYDVNAPLVCMMLMAFRCLCKHVFDVYNCSG